VNNSTLPSTTFSANSASVLPNKCLTTYAKSVFA
jgi:hypothetical protein